MQSSNIAKSKRDEIWRNRRDKTMEAHLVAEASHDVDAIMATFASDAEVIVNGQIFSTPESIRNFHLALGFGGQGALPDLSSPPIRRFVSDEAIIIEYVIRGTHLGIFNNIPASGRAVELPATVIYEFDDEARLKSERAYIDITPLLNN